MAAEEEPDLGVSTSQEVVGELNSLVVHMEKQLEHRMAGEWERLPAQGVKQPYDLGLRKGVEIC